MRWPWEKKHDEAAYVIEVVEDASNHTRDVSVKLDRLEKKTEVLKSKNMHPIVQVVVYRREMATG